MVSSEDFDEVEKMLFLVVEHSKRIRSVRLQKLSIFIKVVINHNLGFKHNPYLLGGFSEEIEEGATALHEEGYFMHDITGFKLSLSGEKEAKIIEKENPEFSDKINKIVKALSEFSDKQVTAITYKMFPELTEHSQIKESIEDVIKKLPVIELGLN